MVSYQELSISFHHWKTGHLLVVIADLVSWCAFYLPKANPTSCHHGNFVNEPIEQTQRWLRKEAAWHLQNGSSCLPEHWEPLLSGYPLEGICMQQQYNIFTLWEVHPYLFWQKFSHHDFLGPWPVNQISPCPKIDINPHLWSLFLQHKLNIQIFSPLEVFPFFPSPSIGLAI